MWRWGWLPSLVLLVWFVPWWLAVYRHFETFGIVREVEPFSVALGELARTTLQADWLRTRVRCAALFSREPCSVREVHLDCDELDELDRELPWSGREWVDGSIVVDGVRCRADIRYRGDTYVHWGRPKKSFRVRLHGPHRLAGMRTFNLCVAKYPEQLNNEITYRLGALLGLLAPRSEPVLLWLNGRRHGAYWMVEQPGAGMLKRAGREPTVIYEGELLCRDAWTGIDNDLFVLPGLWDVERLAAGAETDQADRALDQLLAHLRSPSSNQSAAALASLLDLERFARLSILEQITQTHHFDTFHNWRLHWDRDNRRFEPIVWDPVGWQETMRPAPGESIDLHPAFTVLHAQLHACAAFLAQRDRALGDFFARGCDRALLRHLDDAVRLSAESTETDPNLWPPDRDLVAARRQAFADSVRANLAALRANWIDRPVAIDWCAPAGGGPLVVRIDSPRPLSGLRLRMREPGTPRSVVLGVLRANGRRETLDLAGHWHVDGDELVVRVVLSSALEPGFSFRPDSDPKRNHRLHAVATDYEITLEGADVRAVQDVRAMGEQLVRAVRRGVLQTAATRALFGLAGACF